MRATSLQPSFPQLTSPRGLRTGFACPVFAPDKPGDPNIEQREDQERDRVGMGELMALICGGSNTGDQSWSTLLRKLELACRRVIFAPADAVILVARLEDIAAPIVLGSRPLDRDA